MLRNIRCNIGHKAVKIVSLLVLCMLNSCQREPEIPAGIDDFPRVEIHSSKPYNRISRTDHHCSVTITDGTTQLKDAEGQIRLRGNSTSNRPKRPFTLHLDEEFPVCGMPSASAWILLANYYDKTMLRNALAFSITEESALTWTPHSRFVELWFNNEYKGTYQLCEKIQMHPNRMNMDEDGWLVEVDSRTPEEVPQFRTQQLENTVRVHYPQAASDRQVAEIAAYFTETENALFGANFTDSIEGWRHYIDETSWVDWYIINELAKNVDALFFSSCYMHSGNDGRIVIGPVWDYDLAFGNTTFNGTDSTEGWYIRYAHWYLRLFEDPAFVAAVQKRFAWFYSRREDYFQFIRTNAVVMRPHVRANESVWHTMDRQIWEEPLHCTYDENIDALIEWLDKRFEWLKLNL